jgi:predicted nucleotidyltransferase
MRPKRLEHVAVHRGHRRPVLREVGAHRCTGSSPARRQVSDALGYDPTMTLRNDLTRALTPQTAIVAAWLFGSRARGTQRPDSDVDVALLMDRDPTDRNDPPWELQARLSGELGLEVQLVVVNRAPADLVRRVLRDGVLLIDRDRARRVQFEVRKRNEYFDMTPVWRRIRRLPPGVAP